MDKVSVNDQVCEKCGAAVRLNAAFCYNCGTQVVPDDMIEVVNEREISNAWFKESITEEKATPIKKPTEPLAKKKSVDKIAIEKPQEAAELPKPEIESKPVKKENKTLDTAATMRQKPKPPIKKQVEVIWEEPESAPNVWFLVVAFILLLFAFGLVGAMLYIK